MFFSFLEREYMDQLSTIEWGEFGRFSEKVEFSKKKYLGCVLRACVENPFWAVTLRCQMEQFAMKSWF